MRTRWKNRNNNLNSQSNISQYNPLICITGIEGEGKSSFLKNFPMSTSYQNFLKERYPNVTNPAPIVIYYHYDNDGVEIGLHIIHGALACMGILDKGTKSEYILISDYNEFLMDVFIKKNGFYDRNDVASITVEDAMKMVFEFFGKDRPILILHDNKKNVNKAQAILDILHKLVIKYDNIDVLVTGYLHQYTDAPPPLTPQHHIEYILLVYQRNLYRSAQSIRLVYSNYD